MKWALISLLLLLCILTVAAMALEKPFVDKSACVGCKDCAGICPTAAISLESEKASIDPEICIDCKLCIQACPFRAIKDIK